MKYFSVATAFVLYCDAKHLDILQGSSHARCYLFCSIFIHRKNILELILSFIIKKKTLWPLFMDGVQLPQG